MSILRGNYQRDLRSWGCCAFSLRAWEEEEPLVDANVPMKSTSHFATVPGGSGLMNFLHWAREVDNNLYFPGILQPKGLSRILIGTFIEIETRERELFTCLLPLNLEKVKRCGRHEARTRGHRKRPEDTDWLMPQIGDRRLEFVGFSFRFFLSSKWLLDKYSFCFFTWGRNFSWAALAWSLC